MSNFEQENRKPTEAQQPNPEQQVPDERYSRPVDINQMQEVSGHYMDYSSWKTQNATGLEKKGAEQRFDEFSAVYDSLTPYLARNMSGQKLLDNINNRLDSLNQRLDHAQDKDYDRLYKQIKGMEAAIGFIDSQIRTPTTPEELERMNQNLIQEQTKVLAPMVGKNPSTEVPVISIASQPETQPTIITPPIIENQTGNTEQEQKERRLIDQVLAKCGARISFDMPNGFGDEGGAGGFKIKSDEKIIVPDDGGRAGLRGRIMGNLDTAVDFNGYQTSPSRREERSNLRVNSSADYMAAKGISEFVYIEPVTESTYEQRTKMVDEETSGFMGLGKKVIQVPKTESVKVGERPVATREKIANGENEPCYRLVYTLTPTQDQSNKYLCLGSLRTGQTCDVEIFLPQGHAEAVLRAVRQDPTFVHRLVEEVVIKDIGVPEEWWRKGEEVQGVLTPTRPPYEKWREMSGGKSRMYVVEKSEIQDQINQGMTEFDDRFVKEY